MPSPSVRKPTTCAIASRTFSARDFLGCLVVFTVKTGPRLWNLAGAPYRTGLRRNLSLRWSATLDSRASRPTPPRIRFGMTARAQRALFSKFQFRARHCRLALSAYQCQPAGPLRRPIGNDCRGESRDSRVLIPACRLTPAIGSRRLRCGEKKRLFARGPRSGIRWDDGL